MAKVITLSCPTHGELVAWDPPGPEAPPQYCWVMQMIPRIPRAIHRTRCNQRLVLAAVDEDHG